MNILKIDRAFVQNAVHNSSDAAIVRAVVALGKGLGLTVLAEGVETQQQLDFLRLIQCERAQSYLFSRPLPSAKIVPLLRQRSAQVS